MEGQVTSMVSRIRIVLPVVALGLTLSACGYNTIPTLEEQAKARWADVQNQYQRRADLIPNLVATVQGYAAQEKDVLLGVTQARARAPSVNLPPETLSDPPAMQTFPQAEGGVSGGW